MGMASERGNAMAFIAAPHRGKLETMMTAFGLLVFLFGSQPAAPQSAAEVINRYVAAIGGEDALRAVTTMRYVRTVLDVENGDTTRQSRTTFYSKRPYFYRTERAQRVYVSDGRRAWSGRAAENADSLVWGEARLVSSRDLDFDRLVGAFIGAASKGYPVVFAGTTAVDGVELHVVRVTWGGGAGEWELYFDRSTGLWYGYRAHPDEPTMRVTDYRRVGGVLIPHRNVSVERLPDGTTRVHERVFSEIVVNLDLSDALFLPQGRQRVQAS